jgi:hypothetical protein
LILIGKKKNPKMDRIKPYIDQAQAYIKEKKFKDAFEEAERALLFSSKLV